ncbi:hypothetical protein AM587_10007721 [Phytophthora nicotianae]|uniref:Uncharacterized protein n=1 Tax=Phytophthora nicotianae TaxID=4792 RepID=A0A0W8CTP8_PHYNI|nr:hypothetical protein AM587_10007721 [Phytophthora nicotianae]
MESKVYNKRERAQPADKPSEDVVNNTETVKRRRTSAATSLKDAWYSWYAQESRMWRSTDVEMKHTRFNFKMIVASMKLLIPEGFTLNEKSPTYRDEVLATGTQAEVKLLVFLQGYQITARGAQNVLKSKRKLHKGGF